MKTLLFLCTGNYYRSRFAEELFNHRTAGNGSGWIAQSCGLAIERGVNNVGALSPFALAALQERGLPVRGIDRPPRQCSSLDLQTADHVIALDEIEHRPLMRERFPFWEPGAEYWQVADIDRLSPSVALQLIETQIDALLSRPDFGTPDRKQH